MVGEELDACLDQQDADACMNVKEYVNLRVQVAQTLADLENLVTPRKPG